MNHNIFWSCLLPNPNDDQGSASGHRIEKYINDAFGSFEKFHEDFTQRALTLFGSGYVWLSRDTANHNRLVITTSANQDSPLSEGLRPILVIDVWEHAYYLLHQNKRAAYIENWWNLVNWEVVDTIDLWWSRLEKDEL